MADIVSNGNKKLRLIVGPYLYPFLLDELAIEQEAECFYLSWAGWELYLARHLLSHRGVSGGAENASTRAKALLLPDIIDVQSDYAAIKQLIEAASNLGAAAFLNSCETESFSDIKANIHSYGSQFETSFSQKNEGDLKKSPWTLDERSYLLLWTLSQLKILESGKALHEARAKEKAMWAALKGEEYEDESGAVEALLYPNLEPPERTLYAWKCWRHLSEGHLGGIDVVRPGPGLGIAPEAY